MLLTRSDIAEARRSREDRPPTESPPSPPPAKRCESRNKTKVKHAYRKGTKKRAPSEQKAQAVRALWQGQTDAQSGEELLSTLVRLSTERVLQEALEQAQATTLGRERYVARGEQLGYRNGYENGTLKTAEGVLRGKVPQMRGRDEP